MNDLTDEWPLTVSGETTFELIDQITDYDEWLRSQKINMRWKSGCKWVNQRAIGNVSRRRRRRVPDGSKSMTHLMEYSTDKQSQ